MNEEELIEGLKRGDKRAHEETYVIYNDRIMAAIKKYIDVHEDAEELMQNVFVKAFKKINQFDSNSALGTWLTKIAINTAKNFLESIKRERKAINKDIDISETIEWLSGYSNPEELLVSKEGRSNLIKATRLLPERQRTAFLLFYIEELSQLEISEIMGISVHAVESLINRAKTKFKTLFGDKIRKYN